MKGRNEFIFCETQMINALQHFFDEHFLKDKNFKVTSISQENDMRGNGFRIIVEEKENENPSDKS